MENLTVNLTHGKSKGEIDSPCWVPDPGFDFGIRKRLMESPLRSRFGSVLMTFPVCSEIVFLCLYLKKGLRNGFKVAIYQW